MKGGSGIVEGKYFEEENQNSLGYKGEGGRV